MFKKLEELTDQGYVITICNQPAWFGTKLPRWGVSIFTDEKFVKDKSQQYVWADQLEDAIQQGIQKALNP